MKHVFDAVLTTVLSASLLLQPASAQKVINPYSTLTPKTLDAAIAEVSVEDAAARNKKAVPPRALKDFAKNYQHIIDEKWYPIKNGFSADFVEDGVKSIVYYTTDGRWTGSLKKYHENKLPFEIRDLVKKKYYDYSIFLVDEIATTIPDSELIYVVHLEDAKGYKVVRVVHNEMELMQEIDKL